MAFYRKYRPQTFSDLVGQDHISHTLINAIKSQRLNHAYLLTGPRGTGKTTTARLLAKAINCLNIDKSGEPCNKCELCLDITDGRALDVIEIDAASHTGVDDVREIIDKARLAPNRAKKKVYIIDEVHMLSKSAFNALLKTLEEPPAHVVFILATTEVHKLPATIISRTQRYDFKRVTLDQIKENLKKVAAAEGIEIDDGSLTLLAIAAAGGHRDALGLLEQVASLTAKITQADVTNILGISEMTDIYAFLWAIFNSSAEEGLKIAHRLYADGADMIQFQREVVEVLRKLLIISTCGTKFLEETKENLTELEKMAHDVPETQILEILNIFLDKGKLFKEVSNQLLPIEIAIIEITNNQDTNTKQISNSNNQTKTITSTSTIRERNHQICEGSGSQATIQDDKGDSKTEDFSPIHRGNNGVDKTGAGNNETMESRRPVSDPDESVGSDDSGRVRSMRTPPEIPNPEGASGQSNNDEPGRTEAEKSDQTEKVGKEETIVKAPVFEMTGDLWAKIIETVKKENTSLAALLRDAKPLSVSENKLVLGVKFKFHKDKISEAKNSLMLEKILGEIIGGKCGIACELHEAKKKEAKPASDDELQQAVGTVFELET